MRYQKGALGRGKINGTLLHFYNYLYREKLLLRTDHAALRLLLRFKNSQGQVTRWIECYKSMTST